VRASHTNPDDGFPTSERQRRGRGPALHALVSRLQITYRRFQRFVPLAFFFGGFTYDSLTLTRIDRLSDNLILFGYLLVLGVLVAVEARVQRGEMRVLWVLRYADYTPLAMQFLFGGLFSSYVVFYFRSLAWSPAALFVALLAVLLVANEFLEKRLSNLPLVFALYAVSAFSFWIYFLPVILRVMGRWTFLLSAAVTTVHVGIVWALSIGRFSAGSHRQHWALAAPPASAMLLVIVLYFANWIPPVPLAMKEGGIYHHASRHGNRFVLRYDKPPWYRPWRRSSSPFRYAEGDTVFFFAAVFAPTDLRKRLYHRWQVRDEKAERWITTDRLGYEIAGGRARGYRGITYKRHIRPGRWRVSVETEEGLLLGRIGFKVVPRGDEPLRLRTMER
jgi:hypothetical protein